MAAGLIVAGGRSTRFNGGDKALATVAGTPLIRRVATEISSVSDSLIVNCRPQQVEPFERALDGLDPTFAVDATPDAGPVAGLATGLDAIETDTVAVGACDMPGLLPTLFRRLRDSIGDADAAVPVCEGYPQPLSAVYRVAPARRACRETRIAGDARMQAVLSRLDTTMCSPSALGVSDAIFQNVNTRSDLAVVRPEQP